MMDPDMDPKLRLGHFDIVVSPITSSITYHQKNLTTEKKMLSTSSIRPFPVEMASLPVIARLS